MVGALIGAKVLYLLLNLPGMISDLPLLTRDFPSLAASMFMVGLLSGISGRNEKDLDEDSHLAMLAH